VRDYRTVTVTTREERPSLNFHTAAREEYVREMVEVYYGRQASGEPHEYETTYGGEKEEEG
jgi:hypothetical protein